MARFTPYSLQLQITNLFKNGQSLFATSKVEQWLIERGEDPQAYRIQFVKMPAPDGDEVPFWIKTELHRKDGQPTADWLIQQLQADL